RLDQDAVCEPVPGAETTRGHERSLDEAGEEVELRRVIRGGAADVAPVRVSNPAERRDAVGDEHGEELALDGDDDARRNARAQRLPYVVDAVRACEDDVGHAVAAKKGELVGEEGAVQQRHYRLGSGEGERPEPRPLASGEDDGLSAL